MKSYSNTTSLLLQEMALDEAILVSQRATVGAGRLLEKVLESNSPAEVKQFFVDNIMAVVPVIELVDRLYMENRALDRTSAYFVNLVDELRKELKQKDELIEQLYTLI